ncbi:hypothetical protein [Klebsiella quasipneumoniae]|uniref:hypothetical protein n=1 Tax=Klebsiella quasipneumoniae TaxID=1463165 RepID=UPI00388FC561
MLKFFDEIKRSVFVDRGFAIVIKHQFGGYFLPAQAEPGEGNDKAPFHTVALSFQTDGDVLHRWQRKHGGKVAKRFGHCMTERTTHCINVHHPAVASLPIALLMRNETSSLFLIGRTRVVSTFKRMTP